MARWLNTEYTEFAPNSPNERWGPGSSAMTRTFDLVDGSFLGRLQAAYDFLGYGVVVPTGIAGTPWFLHRVVPMAYPARDAGSIKLPNLADVMALWDIQPPDLSNTLYAIGISKTEPLGQPKGLDFNASPGGAAAANYTRARLTTEFTTLPYLVKTDAQMPTDKTGVVSEGFALASGWQNSRYVVRHLEPFSRLLEVPFGLPKIAGKFLKTGLPLREGGCNAKYTWMRVPLTGGSGKGAVPFSTIQSSIGTLNNDTFDIFPAGTLLLDSIATREYQGAFGERLADVTFNMIALIHPSTGNNAGTGGPLKGAPLGWNYVFTAVGNPPNLITDYYKVTLGDVDPPFVSNDFKALFEPPS